MKRRKNKIIPKFFISLGAPVFIQLPEPIGSITKDESIKFECIIDGNPKPTVSW